MLPEFLRLRILSVRLGRSRALTIAFFPKRVKNPSGITLLASAFKAIQFHHHLSISQMISFYNHRTTGGLASTVSYEGSVQWLRHARKHSKSFQDSNLPS